MFFSFIGNKSFNLFHQSSNFSALYGTIFTSIKTDLFEYNLILCASDKGATINLFEGILTDIKLEILIIFL